MPALDELLRLSHDVGLPERDCAILGEGNTSAAGENGTFWVKGSGCSLGTMAAEDFVQVRSAEVLALLDGACDQARMEQVYLAARVDAQARRRPSVETVMHAICLQQPGVRFVAHTHPAAVNMLTCSPRWRELLAGRLFPDEAVVLGPDSVFIAYVDPGAELARAIRDGLEAYRARYGDSPKSVYMQNHGFIALGGSAKQTLDITDMAVKAARIRLGAIQAGGFRALGDDVVRHLLARPDEKHRQQVLAEKR